MEEDKKIINDENIDNTEVSDEEEKSHKKRLLILLLILFFVIILVFGLGIIIVKNNGMSFNIDINNDGIPELNLDFDTKVCKVNCTNDNKKPKYNIDYAGSQKPTFNVDTTGD